jgi:hypothetical protein
MSSEQEEGEEILDYMRHWMAELDKDVPCVSPELFFHDQVMFDLEFLEVRLHSLRKLVRRVMAQRK